MRAIVWTAYGPPDVLELRDIARPVPAENQLLIRIHATTVTSGDCEMRALSGGALYSLPIRAYAGMRRPTRLTILGMELAGSVEAVGRSVRAFSEGDQIFAATGFEGMGTCAEYICLAEEPKGGAIAVKPANMIHEEAASVPVGGLEALYFVRQGIVRSGQAVLINGAGGTIGTFAVQLAKHLGAIVTAVDSGDKLDALKSIGADKAVDYRSGDLHEAGGSYDFILDIAASLAPSEVKRLMRQGGRHLSSSSKTRFRSEDLVFLKELIEAGELKSVIDRSYPLERTADAHRYVEQERKIGNVVIALD